FKYAIVKCKAWKCLVQMCSQDGQVECDAQQFLITEAAVRTRCYPCFVEQLSPEFEVAVLVHYDTEKRLLVDDLLHNFIEEDAYAREEAAIVSILRLHISLDRGLEVSFLFLEAADVGAQLLQTLHERALPLEPFNIGTQRDQFV